MHFKFFTADFRTPIEEVKKQYHKLVLKFHPDRGGDENTMKRINAEWDYLKKHNYNIHKTKDGSTYTDDSQWSPDDLTERFVAIIEALMKLEGVGIEICGSFIWLDGNTREYKDTIKSLGFKWASRKKKWYAAPSGWKKHGREWKMDEIRGHYGSKIVVEGFMPQNKMLEEA